MPVPLYQGSVVLIISDGKMQHIHLFCMSYKVIHTIQAQLSLHTSINPYEKVFPSKDIKVWGDTVESRTLKGHAHLLSLCLFFSETREKTSPLPLLFTVGGLASLPRVP